MKMQEYAELHKVVSDKEKEVFSLQEQLSTTYKDLSMEIENLRKQVVEASNESSLKDRMLKNQAQAHEEQLQLQSEHIEKLKLIIETKTEMNTTLDLQNQSLSVELNKLR